MTMRPLFSDDTFTFSVSLQRKQFDADENRWKYSHFCGGLLLQVFNRTGIVVSASHCVKNKQVILLFFFVFDLVSGLIESFDHMK